MRTGGGGHNERVSKGKEGEQGRKPGQPSTGDVPLLISVPGHTPWEQDADGFLRQQKQQRLRAL